MLKFFAVLVAATLIVTSCGRIDKQYVNVVSPVETVTTDVYCVTAFGVPFLCVVQKDRKILVQIDTIVEKVVEVFVTEEKTDDVPYDDIEEEVIASLQESDEEPTISDVVNVVETELEIHFDDESVFTGATTGDAIESIEEIIENTDGVRPTPDNVPNVIVIPNSDTSPVETVPIEITPESEVVPPSDETEEEKPMTAVQYFDVDGDGFTDHFCHKHDGYSHHHHPVRIRKALVDEGHTADGELIDADASVEWFSYLMHQGVTNDFGDDEGCPTEDSHEKNIKPLDDQILTDVFASLEDAFEVPGDFDGNVWIERYQDDGKKSGEIHKDFVRFDTGRSIVSYVGRDGILDNDEYSYEYSFVGTRKKATRQVTLENGIVFTETYYIRTAFPTQ